MTISISRNELIVLAITLAAILFILGYQWLIDSYLTNRMTDICENLSMQYLYKDTSSFVCASYGDTITLKVIYYR